MNTRTFIFQLLTGFLISQTLGLPALANDGVGAIGVGGVIAYGKTDAVAMRKERLVIGTQRIDVDYEFINESNVPVTLSVVFPLPAYGGIQEPEDDARGGQPENFTLLIDGVAHPFTSQVRALLATEGDVAPKDVTQILLDIGLNASQIALLPGAFKVAGQDVSSFNGKRSPKVSPVTAEQLSKLRAQGLLTEDPYLRDKDTINYPAWTVHASYAWSITFPVGKVVTVNHSYAPFLGMGINNSWVGGNSDLQAKDLKERFCASPALIRTLSQKTMTATEKAEVPPIWGVTVNYILKTANTWKGPIKDFTLRLKKTSPDESISLCFPGNFKKLDALTLETHLSDFVPATDLDIRFFDTGRSAQSRYIPKRFPIFSGVAPQGFTGTSH